MGENSEQGGSIVTATDDDLDEDSVEAMGKFIRDVRVSNLAVDIPKPLPHNPKRKKFQQNVADLKSKSVDLEVIHWSAEDREQFTAFFDENLANGLIFDYLRKCGLLEPGKKMEVSLLLHALICFYLKKIHRVALMPQRWQTFQIVGNMKKTLPSKFSKYAEKENLDEIARSLNILVGNHHPLKRFPWQKEPEKQPEESPEKESPPPRAKDFLRRGTIVRHSSEFPWNYDKNKEPGEVLFDVEDGGWAIVLWRGEASKEGEVLPYKWGIDESYELEQTVSEDSGDVVIDITHVNISDALQQQYPTKVNVHTSLVSIENVDFENESVEAKLYFFLDWSSRPLDIVFSLEQEFSLKEYTPIWKPTIQILNLREIIEMKDVPVSNGRLHCQYWDENKLRFQTCIYCHCKFAQSFEFGSFPFDAQELVFRFQLKDAAKHSKFYNEQFQRLQNEAFNIRGWSLRPDYAAEKFVHVVAGREYSALQVSIRMRRESMYYIWKYFFILFLLFAGSLSSFAIDLETDLSSRILAILIFLLCTCFFQTHVREESPRLDELTILDIYSLLTFAFQLLILIETCMVSGDDSSFAYFCFCIFAITNGWYAFTIFSAMRAQTKRDAYRSGRGKRKEEQFVPYADFRTK